jgi:hypothetical protein
METAKLRALRDMASEGIIISFVIQEKAILEFISEGLSLKIDFRRFNGGHYDKHSLLLENYYSEDDIQLII